MAIQIRNRPTRGSRGGPMALPAELGGRYLGPWESTVVDASLAQVREAITGSPTGTLPEGIVLETVDDSLIVAAAKAYTRGINARARTTAALPANTRTVDVLQADANGALGAQDGIALVVGDLLLVMNEVAGENNGPYRVDSLGAAGAPWILRRAIEFNETADVARGARVFVEEGTLWRGTNWALDAASVNPTLNTTALTFVEVTGPPSGAAGGQLGGTYPNPTVTLGLAANGMVARTAAATWAQRTITAGVGVAITNGDGVADNPTIASRDQQDLRLLLAVDSQLTGNVIGAATETAHTALTMPTANINEARRTIRFKALLAVNSDNGADTWQVRVRVGGLAGTLIADTGAINIVAGEDLWIEGVIQIRTTGAPGTFQSMVLLTGEGAWPTSRTYVSAGAITTTGAVALAITGTSSSASAAQDVTLRYFEAEIYDA